MTVIEDTQKPAAAPTKSHPSGDDRFTILEATMKRHQYQPDALIEVLHKAQELFGYLSTDVLLTVARSLKLPPSQVYGVSTFYHFFSLTPKGTHTCVVCMGTPCYVNGAADVLAAVERRTGVRAGQTTPDAGFSLQNVRCIGACGMAPLAILDDSVVGFLTPESIAEYVKGWIEDGAR
jgi:bidirectional [NiFe] hydrogenase diaphorase subunit